MELLTILVAYRFIRNKSEVPIEARIGSDLAPCFELVFISFLSVWTRRWVALECHFQEGNTSTEAEASQIGLLVACRLAAGGREVLTLTH